MEIYNNLLDYKKISLDIAIRDYHKLTLLDTNTFVNSRVGTMFINYFTFKERLDTRGIKGMNYLEFLSNEDYLNRTYIKNLIEYQKNKKVKPEVMMYEIYKFHCGSVGMIKPITIKRILQIYKPVSVLDPFMGWGSSLVSCCAMNIPHFYGIKLTKEQWNELYIKIFTNVYLNTKRGGYLAINCPTDIYLLLLTIMGNELTKFPLNQKSRYNNAYQEYIYIWKRF